MGEPISPTATALVALMRLKGVGRRAALRIVEGIQHANGDEVFDLVLLGAERAKLPEGEVLEAWKYAQEELEKSLAAGVQFFSIHEEGYPKRLRRIPDPPAVLFVKGDTKGLHSDRCLAVVGTREPTSYGEKVARKSAAAAAEAHFTIVSGLAHGCDTLGHEGCLDVGGVGVAVMAHGLDKVYPAANRDLARRLLDRGGCLVSEYPLGVTPMRTAFAERDRIQSGLSDGVLVIETDVKGGTMHTVRFSRDQQRALACIDHPTVWRNEDKTKGNQKLIADRWAVAIPDGTALAHFLGNLGPPTSHPSQPSNPEILDPQISMDF